MILVNGTPGEHVQVNDRGLMYGDGVFRTLLIRAGKPFCWQRQYAKLRADCQALNITCPSSELLEQELAVIGAAEPDCVAKIMLTRGHGARGYAPILSMPSTRILSSAQIPIYPNQYLDQGVEVHVCNFLLSRQPRLAGIKHMNRLENVMARMEWDDPALAEGLLLDTEGNVIEGTMSNLFMVKESTLFTPDLSQSGVAGVTRDRIMALAPALGLSLAVGNYSLDYLLESDEVLLCNSVIGVWQVRVCREKRWEPGCLTPKLRSLLTNEEH
jgi:4-amino-4-deoxychorismate lyase